VGRGGGGGGGGGGGSPILSLQVMYSSTVGKRLPLGGDG